jgi:hypothetical protein
MERKKIDRAQGFVLVLVVVLVLWRDPRFDRNGIHVVRLRSEEHRSRTRTTTSTRTIGIAKR